MSPMYCPCCGPERRPSRQAAETFILATREKLGAASPYGIIPLADVSTLVTDAAPADEVLGALRAELCVIHA